MKNTHRILLPFLALMLIACILIPERAAAMATPAFLSGPASVIEDVRGAMRDVRETLDGLKRFFAAINSAVSAVTDLIGTTALILLVAVIVISTLLSFAGIPRGPSSFVVSLAFADVIWVLWMKSFAGPGGYSIMPVVKANAMLLLPLAGVYLAARLLRRSAVVLAGGALASVKSLFRGGRMSHSRAVSLTKRLHAAGALLEERLMGDILGARNGSVHISRVTIESAKALAALLDELKSAKNEDDGDSCGA
jgi:hypothetical protein